MMRAIAAFLLLLAGGAEGRLPLFGQTEGDSNKCGAACEWFASAPVDGNADATCGNRVEYLIEDEGDDAVTACGRVATESPKICGGCACGESCPWEASAPVADDGGATCGSRVRYEMQEKGENAAEASSRRRAAIRATRAFRATATRRTTRATRSSSLHRTRRTRRRSPTPTRLT